MTERKSGIRVLLSFFFMTCCLGLFTAVVCFLGYGSIRLLDKSPYSPFFAPTPTIDLACRDEECLAVCMQQLPDMINQTDSLNWTNDAQQKLTAVDIARYKVAPDRQSLKLSVLPAVPDDLKKYQDDLALHQRIWRYYIKIFPETQRLQISYVVFYTDGPRGTSGYIRELGHVWHLYIDLQNFNSQYDTTETLIHEYGHMLTLNDSQIFLPDWSGFREWSREEFDELAKTCPDFFTGVYCAHPNSYLAQFGQRFWTKEIYDAWVEYVYLPRAKDWDNNQDAAYEFYKQHADLFVSSYAATNPSEDLAETWVDFVLKPKPSETSIAGQKVLFLYEINELVQTRQKIIQGICRYAAEKP